MNFGLCAVNDLRSGGFHFPRPRATYKRSQLCRSRLVPQRARVLLVLCV